MQIAITTDTSEITSGSSQASTPDLELVGTYPPLSKRATDVLVPSDVLSETHAPTNVVPEHPLNDPKSIDAHLADPEVWRVT